MPEDLEIYGKLQEGRTSLDLEIPLKKCGNINEDNLWWEKAIKYCPDYRPTDILFGDFNYKQQSWMRLIIHRCNAEEIKKKGLKCASKEEQDRYLENNILYL